MPETNQDSAHLTDFSDRFSPMLVKELRQGLRTNLFTTAFMLLQGFMILCILMGATESGSNEASNGFFWFLIVAALIVVQPLRGFAALSSEYTLNTMDLVQLTRLDAWRITWGKWCAINAQSLLLLVAVIPYLVLRYFFGSVDILLDLGMLGLCAVSSALLSGITIGCSAFRNLIVRIALLIGFTFGFSVLWAYTTEELLDGRISASEGKQIVLLIYVSLFVGFFLLLIGASRIAPASENYAFRKRLLALAAAAGAWSFQLIGTDPEPCNIFASIILALALIDSFTENLPVFTPVLAPFARKAPLKVFSYLLTPGWHTGILFFIFPCFPLWMASVMNYYSFETLIDSASIIIFGAGMLTFPLLIIHLFFRKGIHSRFTLYITIQICLAFVTFLTIAVSSGSGNQSIAMMVPIPSTLFFSTFAPSTDISPPFLVIGAAWLVASLFVPLLHAIRSYRAMSEILRSSS